MAVEPWNKVNIPCPDATASCNIRFTVKTAKVTEDVLLHSENVLKLLKSEVLLTEIKLLYKILYVVNNSFRQHKTFRAIKQVEKCINRLNKMKLQEALEGLQELCPNNIQRDIGVDVAQCNVPSQPMLEWFCLKLLGASSLLSQTLDQCSKAFLLTKQHLSLSEFIVLNLVLVSMLSRLWVFFRGILMTLVPLYKSILNLLLDVIPCHPMAFLTDFTLPVDMTMFLGPARSNLSQEKFAEIKVTKLSLLDRLFEKETEVEVENEEKKGLSLDLDINPRLQQIKEVTKPVTAEAFIKSSLPELNTFKCLNIVEMIKKFLTQLKIASSLGDMEEHLKEMMGWCRRFKLYQEHSLLAFTLLRCRKMKTAEFEGLSVQKRLHRLCLWLHRVLLIGKSCSRPSYSLQLMPKCFLRTRFPTLMARYGSVRNRFGVVTVCCRELSDVRTKLSKKGEKSKKYVRVSSLHAGISKSGDSFSMKKNKMEKSISTMNNSEIDEIFSCIV